MTAGALVVSLLGVSTSFQSGRCWRQKSQCVSRLGGEGYGRGWRGGGWKAGAGLRRGRLLQLSARARMQRRCYVEKGLFLRPVLLLRGAAAAAATRTACRPTAAASARRRARGTSWGSGRGGSAAGPARGRPGRSSTRGTHRPAVGEAARGAARAWVGAAARVRACARVSARFVQRCRRSRRAARRRAPRLRRPAPPARHGTTGVSATSAHVRVCVPRAGRKTAPEP